MMSCHSAACHGLSQSPSTVAPAPVGTATLTTAAATVVDTVPTGATRLSSASAHEPDEPHPAATSARQSLFSRRVSVFLPPLPHVRRYVRIECLPQYSLLHDATRAHTTRHYMDMPCTPVINSTWCMRVAQTKLYKSSLVGQYMAEYLCTCVCACVCACE